MLVFIYRIGVGVPIILPGTTAASFMTRLAATQARVWAERLSGLVLIGVGLYMLWIA